MRVWLWLVYKIYRELLSLATFLRVYSNSKEVSYLYWQNRYSNLKSTCHTKLKFFLWTKLLENLLLAKYLISVDFNLLVTTLSCLFQQDTKKTLTNLPVQMPRFCNQLNIFLIHMKMYTGFTNCLTFNI